MYMPIITIIAIIVAVVVLYIFLSGNGIKFKIFGKKEHKVKASKSNEEKYKDVLPKEKAEKKEPKTKFFSSAKKEKIKNDIKKELTESVAKSKEASVPASKGTVTKITKEDFIKNNISLPSGSLFGDDDKKNTAVVLPKAKEQPYKPYDFGISEEDMSDPFGMTGGDSQDEQDPFSGVDIDALLNSSDEDFDAFLDGKFGLGAEEKNDKPTQTGDQLSDKKYSQLDAKEYFSNKAFGENTKPQEYSAPIINKTLGDRFEEVFGDKFREMGGTEQGKEVIVSDILGAPRSEINKMKRAEREKRKKWM